MVKFKWEIDENGNVSVNMAGAGCDGNIGEYNKALKLLEEEFGIVVRNKKEQKLSSTVTVASRQKVTA